MPMNTKFFELKKKKKNQKSMQMSGKVAFRFEHQNDNLKKNELRTKQAV